MRRPLLFVLIATVGFAIKGVIAKLAYATGLTVIGLLALRAALAVPLFWLGARWLGAVWTGMQRRDVAAAVGSGLLYLIAGYCDFTAIDYIGAGPSRVLLFTYPLLVLLLEAGRDRRLPRWRELLAFGLAWPGLWLVASAGELENPIGAAWALGSATSYALYLFIGQQLMPRLGSVRFATLANTGAGLFLLAALPWLATPATLSFNAEAFGLVATIALFSTVLPFFLFFEGIRQLGAGRASLITLSGPPLTLLMAWAVLDERLTPAQLLGALLVLAGVGSLRLGSAKDP